jgi:hypothetical protein
LAGQPSVQNIFPTVHYFKLCVPITQQPGQAVVQGRLSLNFVFQSVTFMFQNFFSWTQRRKLRVVIAVEAKAVTITDPHYLNPSGNNYWSATFN